MVRVKVEYTCEYSSDDGMDQWGRIIVTHPKGGTMVARWDCEGGKGRGAELRENTTPWSDNEADAIVNAAELCQGDGTYYADIEVAAVPHPVGGIWWDIDVDNVEWIG